MKRSEWRRKSRSLASSALILLRDGENSTAYYLAGLSIECALKAKIARRFLASDIPKKQLVDSVYKHDLEQLLGIAQLKTEFDADCIAKPQLNSNWQIAKAWNVDARYADWSHAEANDMVHATTARGNGVLAWIRRNW